MVHDVSRVPRRYHLVYGPFLGIHALAADLCYTCTFFLMLDFKNMSVSCGAETCILEYFGKRERKTVYLDPDAVNFMLRIFFDPSTSINLIICCRHKIEPPATFNNEPDVAAPVAAPVAALSDSDAWLQFMYNLMGNCGSQVVLSRSVISTIVQTFSTQTRYNIIESDYKKMHESEIWEKEKRVAFESHYDCMLVTTEGDILCVDLFDNRHELNKVIVDPVKIAFFTGDEENESNIKFLNISSSDALYHTGAISTEGDVYTWGCEITKDEESGKLKWGNPAMIAKKVSIQTPIVLLAVGAHTLAIANDGSAWSWGMNTHGQCGYDPTIADNIYITSPRRLSFGDDPRLNFKSAAVGTFGQDEDCTTHDYGEHSLLIDEHGQLFSFGCGKCGQLGNGNTSDRHIPERVDGFPENCFIAMVSAGRSHSLAVTLSGDVYAWGSVEYGVLGFSGVDAVHGSRVHTEDPTFPVAESVRFETATRVIIDNMSDISIVLSTSSVNRHQCVPKKVESLKDVVSVTIYDILSCAVTKSGNLFTWGARHFGPDIIGYPAEPEAMMTETEGVTSVLVGVVAVAMSGIFVLAVDNLDTVWLWSIENRTRSKHMYPLKIGEPTPPSIDPSALEVFVIMNIGGPVISEP